MFVAARLLVAADGAHSSIRRRAGIASHGWNYGQSAIVTTVSLMSSQNNSLTEALQESVTAIILAPVLQHLNG